MTITSDSLLYPLYREAIAPRTLTEKILFNSVDPESRYHTLHRLALVIFEGFFLLSLLRAPCYLRLDSDIVILCGGLGVYLIRYLEKSQRDYQHSVTAVTKHIALAHDLGTGTSLREACLQLSHVASCFGSIPEDKVKPFVLQLKAWEQGPCLEGEERKSAAKKIKDCLQEASFVLNLSGFQLTSLPPLPPEFFPGLQMVRVDDLAYNYRTEGFQGLVKELNHLLDIARYLKIESPFVTLERALQNIPLHKLRGSLGELRLLPSRARDHILACLRDHSSSLDLSDCGLASLPLAVQDTLSHIEELNLSGNDLSSLRALVDLPLLNKLNIRNNPRLRADEITSFRQLVQENARRHLLPQPEIIANLFSIPLPEGNKDFIWEWKEIDPSPSTKAFILIKNK